MKLSSIWILAFVSMVLTKNVFDLDKLQEQARHKREAKYAINLNLMKSLSGREKRDAKNVISLSDLKSALKEGGTSKRDVYPEFEYQENEVSVEQDESHENEVVFSVNYADSSNNLLQSILPQVKEISVFAGYIRDNFNLNEKTERTDEITLIIAPTDNSLENDLRGLKPWEFPVPLDKEASPEENERIAQNNLENFLNNHVIINFETNLALEQDNIVVTKLVSGVTIKIKEDLTTEQYYVSVHDEWVNVQSVRQVDNGIIFVVDDPMVKFTD